MPSESLTLAVSTGFGISVVAGIISGICYILAHGITHKRSRKPNQPWQCAVCSYNFRNVDGTLEDNKVVTCTRCKARICRIVCSSLENFREGWVCQTCKKRNQSFFTGLLEIIQPDRDKDGKEAVLKLNMSREKLTSLDRDLERLRKKDKEEIRDFIESLVCAILKSDVDDAPVSKLYNDKNYLPNTGDTPTSAHASLKLLIQRIIRDAIDLPKLTGAADQSLNHSEESRTYEDLLATAVINKVIHSYQDDCPSSSGVSISSQYSSSSKIKEKEYFFGTETLNKKWQSSNSIPDIETVSHSSIEDWVRCESNPGSIKFVDQLSLSIHQRIDETSTSDDEAEPPKPEMLHTSSIASIQSDDSDWQSNWYLRKRKYNGTHSPVPVPMLVPNPTSEAKVLIGDKEAEETSDLSDAASDYGDMEFTPAINTILIESKTLIGGRNLFNNINLSDEFEENDGRNEDNGVNDVVGKEEKIVDVLESNRQDVEEKIVNGNEHHQFDSLESQTEQDSEYTEKYATLPKTILKSPAPTPRSSVLPKSENGIFPTETETEYADDSEVVIKGSYSEREKEKWKHAVHLENNPYSRENIERRLSSRSSSSSSGLPFGRDYYIKAAAKPTGARKAKESVVSGDDEEQIPPLPKSPPPIVLSALKPEEASSVEINEEKETVSESEFSDYEAQFNQLVIELSSDSDLSIERVYNTNTGEIIVQSSEGKDENHNDVKVTHANEEVGDESADITLTFPEKQQENVSPSLVTLIEHYEKINKCDKRPKEITLEKTEAPACTPEVFLKSEENESSAAEAAMNGSTSEDTFQEADSNGYELNPKKSEDKTEELFVDFSTEASEDNSLSDIVFDKDFNEIVELQDKHIVQNVLDELSQLYPNITKVHGSPRSEGGRCLKGVTNDGQETGLLPSVQDLRKKFEEFADVGPLTSEMRVDKHVYSLTARSIPRQVRQELKNQGELTGLAENIEQINGAISLVMDETIGDVTESPAIFPKTKMTIEYFEQLSNK